jgi:osmoprotectant transport system substrate-binding protein
VRLRLIIVAVAIALAGMGVVVFSVLGSEAAPDTEVAPVRVGVGGDAESLLLGHVAAELVRAHGIEKEVVTFGHARDARRALNLGEVEVVPMHTGAVWLDQLGWADPPGDPETSFERVRDADERRDLLWLGPTRANATFTFVVAAPPDESAALDSLVDLAVAANADPEVVLCVDPDFAERPDGLAEVARIYGVSDEVLAHQVLAVPSTEAVVGVTRGGCTSGLTTATDGQAWLAGLYPLSDPQRTFPAFVVAPVVSREATESHPSLREALEPFGPDLTTDRLAAWNGRVIAGEGVDAVAGDAAGVLLELHRRAQEEDGAEE